MPKGADLDVCETPLFMHLIVQIVYYRNRFANPVIMYSIRGVFEDVGT